MYLTCTKPQPNGSTNRLWHINRGTFLQYFQYSLFMQPYCDISRGLHLHTIQYNQKSTWQWLWQLSCLVNYYSWTASSCGRTCDFHSALLLNKDRGISLGQHVFVGPLFARSCNMAFSSLRTAPPSAIPLYEWLCSTVWNTIPLPSKILYKHITYIVPMYPN